VAALAREDALGLPPERHAQRPALARQDALHAEATLGLPPERLGDRAALREARLRAEVIVPRLALSQAGAAMPIAGTLAGHATLSGSAGAPSLAGDLAGESLAIEGRPLGELAAKVRYERGRGVLECDLRPASGGTLHAALTVSADLGLDGRGPSLAEAPAQAVAQATALDLGFLSAAAPGTIRSAAGRLDLDVRAAGPLARMTPRGTMRISSGRVAVAELAEWHDIALDAKVTADAIELSKLEVRRGKGSLSAKGALRGLEGREAKLTASASAKSLTVLRAGMEIATVTAEVKATGTYRDRALDVDVTVPKGVVRLPPKAPRTLQPLEARKDITVRAPEKPGKKARITALSEPGARPLVLRVHGVVPREFFVKSDNPKVDVELKADVHYEQEGFEQTYLSGSIEVVRGVVEPLAGRSFTIEKGVVQFTGGPPSAALLDIGAKYTNPVAQVDLKVQGTVNKPEVKLSSQPPMDESRIALLLATGRVDVKPGAQGAGSLTGGEAGMAALGAVATQAFKNLVQDKLPLDTVALDAGGLRAGKYLSDQVYVGYVYRWDADPTRYENTDELRVDYQVTQRWVFESRYGNAQSGEASLMWSKDY
jgi:translocation and assembly module TamB